MARISLIICDLCGNKINDDEAGLYEVSLICNTDKSLDGGEICGGCHRALLHRLRADAPLTIQEKAATAPQLTASPMEPIVEVAAPESALGPTKEEKSKRKPTDKLLDDELVKVPSRFDRKKANDAVVEMKGGSCPHNFKTVNDKGQIVCAAAPPGCAIPADAQGHSLARTGCGKVLTKAEY